MFPFLSSARIHLNSRCLSQAVFDSGSVWFWCRGDKTIFVEGLGAGWYQQGPGPAPGRDPRGAAAAAHQQDGWGAAPAGALGAPQRAWLRSPAGSPLRALQAKRAAPRDARQRLIPAWDRSRDAWQRAPGPRRCAWEVNANLSHLGSLEFFSTRVANSSRCFFLYWQGKAMNVLDECKKTFKLEWELTLVPAS